MRKGGHAEEIFDIHKRRRIRLYRAHDSVMIMSAIDMYERCDVMTIYCPPGAFLRAMASDPVLMKLFGPLVEVLLLIDLAMYQDYLRYNGQEKKRLYMWLKN